MAVAPHQEARELGASTVPHSVPVSHDNNSAGAVPGGSTIGGNLFAQYLFSMLANQGGQGPNGMPFPGLMGDLPENGRWGDYVFNQEGMYARKARFRYAE